MPYYDTARGGTCCGVTAAATTSTTAASVVWLLLVVDLLVRWASQFIMIVSMATFDKAGP